MSRERIALVYELIVLELHLIDIPGDTTDHGTYVTVYLGIVGVFVMTSIGELGISPCRDRHKSTRVRITGSSLRFGAGVEEGSCSFPLVQRTILFRQQIMSDKIVEVGAQAFAENGQCILRIGEGGTNDAFDQRLRTVDDE